MNRFADTFDRRAVAIVLSGTGEDGANGVRAIKRHGGTVGAQEMWGLHDQEVRGKHLLDLDFGLPLNELKAGIRKSLSTVHESGAIVEATNRRGHRFICHVICSPLIGARGNVRGAILVMEDEERRQQETTA